MPAAFPTAPRAPFAVRIAAIGITAVAVALATRTTITSWRWTGRSFPGFMVLANRVVPSIALANWSGSAVPNLFQSEVIAVDGRPTDSPSDVYSSVAGHRPGTAVRYRLRRNGHDWEVAVPVQRFTVTDWVLLFGAFLLSGATYLLSGLVVWILRPRAALSHAFLAVGTAWGFFLFTALDLYGPATFFRLHVICESLVPPAVVQLALLFPQPHRFARWRFAAYVPSIVIIVLYETFLHRPAIYTSMLYANMTYLGVATLFFGGRLLSQYVAGGSALARQRVRLVMLGTLAGFSLPGVIVLVSVVKGGGTAMNWGAMTQFLFSLSLAYAIVKHDLFEIDAMVKRAAYYLVLSGIVAAMYVTAVVLVDQVLKQRAVTSSIAFPVLFTLAVLLVFDPLRARFQALVDRVFFRTAYDPAAVLADAGAEIASALTRERIAVLVRQAVDRALPNAGTRLFVRDDASRMAAIGAAEFLPPSVVAHLARGRLVTAFDPAEAYADATEHEAVRAALAGVAAELAVPLALRGELVGALTVGPKRSGLFYTGGDAEFLQTLAHQAASALENARSYEALVELNQRLEERVRERTSQLEGANRELVEAYGELKRAEGQLVHSEKMASLGRLVAGVAHEINNPVSFISTNVVPLRRRLTQAAAGVSPELQRSLDEADELAAIMARGAERTAAIVRDLRTFSRLGESRRKAVDLHEGVDVTLRLLEPRWRDRITIHRDYGRLPPVECDPGQVNQVFLNVLANACDAIAGPGNVWITTRADGGTVTVAIRDDGAGMTPELAAHVFDPFFTTKDVGAGTGLGLAISHGVVVAHGGDITVESRPGAGSTFCITLPVGEAAPARAAR